MNKQFVRQFSQIVSKKQILGLVNLFSLISVPVSGALLIQNNFVGAALTEQTSLFGESILQDYALDARLRIEPEITQNISIVGHTTLAALARVDGLSETSSVKQEAIKVNRKQNGYVSVTAYSSTYDQTDSSPFITANGTYVYDGVIAANFLPFGTKVKFPEYSGDKIYTVDDRMNSRYSYKMDIWFPTRSQALQFGYQTLYYEVVG